MVKHVHFGTLSIEISVLTCSEEYFFYFLPFKTHGFSERFNKFAYDEQAGLLDSWHEQ